MIGSPPDASAETYSSSVSSGGGAPDAIKSQAKQSNISSEGGIASEVGNNDSNDGAINSPLLAADNGGSAQGLAQQKKQRLENALGQTEDDFFPLIDEAQTNGAESEIELADPIYPLLGGNAPFNVGAALVARRRSNRFGLAGAATTNPHDIAGNMNDNGVVFDEMSLQDIGRKKIGLASCGHPASIQGNCIECEKLRLFWGGDNNNHPTTFEAIHAQGTIE